MTPARILVVEDDRVVARHLEAQLSRMGHVVVGRTASGEQAYAIALKEKPDLVLMDIRLEGPMDGIVAAGRIRSACKIPIVFLTAYADDETVKRASLTEPFGYLLKPFEDSQLRTVIEMALYKHAADRKLRDSERRYAATLSSIGDAVIATDERGRVTFMNPVAERLTGWAQADAMDLPLSEVFVVINEDTRQRVDSVGPESAIDGVRARSAVILIDRNGHECPVDEFHSPIIDDHGIETGAVIVFRDLTRLRETEKALRDAQGELSKVSQSTRMGELAASIAHQINQPLAAIAANASAGRNWLKRETPDLPEAERVLTRIQSDASRAADVIRSLQSLARKTGPEHVRLDLHATIDGVISLTRAELRRHDVRLVMDLASCRLFVMADRVLVQQVLLNLITNAIEAMCANDGTSRTLSIRTSQDEGDWIRTQVGDSGGGLDLAIRDRLFEPFFTTKPAGMGMGLAICRSIVESHDGRLWARSHQPYGTEFVFELHAAPSGETRRR